MVAIHNSKALKRLLCRLEPNDGGRGEGVRTCLSGSVPLYMRFIVNDLNFFSFQVLAFVVVLLLIIDIIVSLFKYFRLKRRQAEQ